jgi:dihydrofolate reductase
MRKIVAGFACSLDGYIEGPNGEYDWILIDKEIDFIGQMKQYDSFFYGRKTYESVIKMGKVDLSAQHYVFSRSLTEVKPGYTLLKGDLFEEVTRIKKSPGKDIAIFGGAVLLASLIDLGLVDEISVSFIPVLLGSGKPMVSTLINKAWLSLQHTKTYSNGTVVLTYSINTNLQS